MQGLLGIVARVLAVAASLAPVNHHLRPHKPRPRHRHRIPPVAWSGPSLLSRIFGSECIYPAAAVASVNGALDEFLSAPQSTDQEQVSNSLIGVWLHIDHTASVAADAILATSPELNRESIHKAMATELWQAVREIAELARSGARLI